MALAVLHMFSLVDLHLLLAFWLMPWWNLSEKCQIIEEKSLIFLTNHTSTI